MTNAQLFWAALLGLFSACAPADDLTASTETGSREDDKSTESVEREDDAIESHDWSYDGIHGPQHWTELDQANEACGHVSTQSPINLLSRTPVEDLPDLVHAYLATGLEVVNTGHTIEYKYEHGSKVLVGRRSYDLVQLHFHAHSEHTLDGEYAPMELHLVHRDQTGSYLVVGVFVEKGDANASLAAAGWDELPRAAHAKLVDATRQLNALDLIPGGPTFRYSGSLTTPPCSETVSWVVYQKPISMSRAQLEAFERVYDHDFRPLQPLGHRRLTYGE